MFYIFAKLAKRGPAIKQKGAPNVQRGATNKQKGTPNRQRGALQMDKDGSRTGIRGRAGTNIQCAPVCGHFWPICGAPPSPFAGPLLAHQRAHLDEPRKLARRDPTGVHTKYFSSPLNPVGGPLMPICGVPLCRALGSSLYTLGKQFELKVLKSAHNMHISGQWLMSWFRTFNNATFQPNLFIRHPNPLKRNLLVLFCLYYCMKYRILLISFISASWWLPPWCPAAKESSTAWRWLVGDTQDREAI